MHRLVIVTLMVALLVSAALVALAEDATVEEPQSEEEEVVRNWPRFFGPTADGIAPDEGLNHDWAQRPPAKQWQVALSDDGYAGPAVAEGTVYLVDHVGADDLVRALDLETGQERWRFSYTDAPQHNYGFARATPAIAEGKVYTLSRLGQVHCLDAASGEKLWSRNIQADFQGNKPTWDYCASPIVDGQAVIVLPGGPDAAVVALDKDTGATLWAGGGSDRAGYATPVIAEILGVRQYVVFNGKALTGVATEDGRLLWRLPWETAHDVNSATPLVAGNYVFISSGYGKGCALVEVTPAGPQIRWQHREIMAHFNSPVAYRSYLFGIGDPGFLVCLDPATGQALWKQEGFEKGGVVAVDGMILALAGGTGDLVMVEATAEGYRERGRFTPLGGQSWTAPIVADGRLIVRNRQAIACFDLR